MSHRKIINCNPGPARLPESVLLQAQQELIHYKNTGISVMEMSHRSPEFGEIVQSTERLLREIMNIPDNYRVLFMHGGGTGQFASVPLNLCSSFQNDKVNYLPSGTWSEKAAKEAEKYVRVNRVVPKPGNEGRLTIPDQNSWNIDPQGKYLFYTDNETIHGIEYSFEVKTPFDDKMPIVIDMTSNFLTRPVNVSNFGVIIAGTQKNAGIAALAVVIVREDLIGKAMSICPTIFDFKIIDQNKSLYNTPPCYAIYMSQLFLEWIKEQGGLEEMGRRAVERSRMIYDVLDQSSGFYCNKVDKKYRSRVNICFRIGSENGDDDLEKRFVDEGKKLGIIGIKGHRLVGGIRISLFNATPVEDAKFIANFMLEFMKQNRKN